MWRDNLIINLILCLMISGVCVGQISFLRRIGRSRFNPATSFAYAQLIIFGVAPLYRVAVNADPAVPFIHPTSTTPALAAGLIFAIGTASGALLRSFLDERYLRATASNDATKPSAPARWSSSPTEQVLASLIATTIVVALCATLANISNSGGLTVFLAGRSEHVIASNTIGYLAYSPMLITAAVTAACVLRKSQFSTAFRVVVFVGVLVNVAAFVPQGARRFMIPAVAVPLVARAATTGVRASRKNIILGFSVSLLVLGTIPFLRAAGAREQAGGWHVILANGLASPASTLDRILTSHDTAMPENLALQLEFGSVKNSFGAYTAQDIGLSMLPSRIVSTPPSVHDRILTELHGKGCVPRSPCEDQSVIGSFYYEGGLPFVAFGGIVAGWILIAVHARWYKTRRPGHTANLAVAFVFAPIIFRAVLTPPAIWLLIVLVPCKLFLWILQTPGNLTTPAVPKPNWAQPAHARS